MKTFKTWLTAGTITAAGLGFAWAQQQSGQQSEAGAQAQPENRRESQMQQPGRDQPQEFGARSGRASHRKMTQLKGTSIETQEGRSLGEVEELAVDLQTGSISFVLVSGEEGGDRMVPVPPTALRVRTEGGDTKLTLDIEQTKWEQAPKVGKSEVAQLDQRAREIYRHFGETYPTDPQQFGAPDRPEQPGGPQEPSRDSITEPGPTGAQRPGGRETPSTRTGAQSSDSSLSGAASEFGAANRGREGLKLGSKLMEATVNAPDQEGAARITDLILNLKEGYVDLVLLESNYVDGTFGVVPQAFEVIQEDQLRLNVSQEDLEQAQQLQQAQIGQRAQQARMANVQQTRRNPEVYRLREGQDSLFGTPGDRDSKTDSQKREDRKSESKSGEPKVGG